MSWLDAQTALFDAATSMIQFTANWFLQSAVLLAIGLAMGRLLALRGSAVQSAIYRTTLLAVLLCPIASVLHSLSGVSGWSLAVPRPWTHPPTEAVATAAVETESAPPNEPATIDVPATPATATTTRLVDGGEVALEGSTPLVAIPEGADITGAATSDLALPESVTAASEDRPIAGHYFGWMAVALVGGWFLLSAAMLARLCAAWWQLARLRQQALPADGKTRRACRALATRLGISPPRVYRSAYLPSPCLAGIRRPVVLLPEVDLSVSLRDVLTHELAHLIRRDCHWNLLRQLALAAFFFQPLLWKLSRRLETTAEEVCDDYVVEYGGDRHQYASRLVDIAELALAPMAAAGVGMVSLRSMLAQRVVRIMDTSRVLSTRVGRLLSSLVVAVGLAGTVVVGLIGSSSRQLIAQVAAVDRENSGTPPAAESAAVPVAPGEQPAAAPGIATAQTLSFTRDSLHFAVDTFDTHCLAFSADDRFLAAGGGGDWTDQNAGYARIWDLAGRKEVASYPATRGIQSVTLSPDGKRVALCSWSGDIWLREVGGAELMHDRFGAHVKAAFSPDGKLLVGATKLSQLRTWDAITGKQFEKDFDANGKPIVAREGAFRGATFPFYWVGFSPDGKHLVACGGKANERNGVKFAVWSVASRQQLYKKMADLDRIFSASISSDGQTLATSGETSIPLWDLATGVRRTETEETGGTVYRVEFSTVGSLLASTSHGEAHGVTLWDSTTGKAVNKIDGHQGLVRALAFTHDGKTLATGGADRTVRLWDVATRQQTDLLQGAKAADADADEEPAAILAVACSPDGESVATASENGQVDFHGPIAGGSSRSWIAHADGTAALAFSPDGKKLATCGFDNLVKIWNPATGELILSLAGHTGWVRAIAFSPNGQTLATAGNDRTIRLWNAADGQQRAALSGHGGTIRTLAFSHNDKLLASGGADETVRLWDLATGREQAIWDDHEAPVRSVAFSADDRLLASGSEDQTVRIWNVESRDLRGTLTGHTEVVSAVAFAQQTLVSASWDHTLRTWDAEAIQPRAKLTVGPSEVVALAIDSGGRSLLTASADRSLALWKATPAAGQHSNLLGEYRDFPWAADFSPDGTCVAVAAAGKADVTDFYLYDAATKAEKYKVTFPGSVRSFAFAPRGDVIALGFTTKRVLLIEAATGKEVAELEPAAADAPDVPSYRVGRVAFSPDGKLLAAAAYDLVARIYDVEQRALVKTLKGDTYRILSLTFSPDQKQLIACIAGKPAIVWDLASGEPVSTLALGPDNMNVASAAFSPDGSLLVTGFSGDLCSLRDAKSGSILRTFPAHHGIVFESIFSPDGRTLATSGEDGLVKLWDVANGNLLRTYDCQNGSALYVRFSPDGKSLVTASNNGQARLWQVLPPESK